MKNIEIFNKEEILNKAVQAVKRNNYKKAAINSMLFNNSKLVADRVKDLRTQISESTSPELKPLLEKLGNTQGKEPKDVLTAKEFKVYNKEIIPYNEYVNELLDLEAVDFELRTLDVDELGIDLDIETEFLLRNFQA